MERFLFLKLNYYYGIILLAKLIIFASICSRGENSAFIILLYSFSAIYAFVKPLLPAIHYLMRRRHKRRLTIGLTLLGVICLFTSFLMQMDGQLTTSAGKLSRVISCIPNRFVLRLDKYAKFPYSMDLHLSGKINGSGILSFSSSDLIPYETDTISNSFNVDYNHGEIGRAHV